MFDRFPNSFHFNYKSLQIEFKNSSRGLSFWLGSQRRLIDLLDIVYVPLEFEGTNEHNMRWTNENIKKVAISYANRVYKNVL